MMKELMERYKTNNLKHLSPEEFQNGINSMVHDTSDYKIEGYDSPKGQRTISINFHWGHNHDFGSFQIKGMMQDRHIQILDWYAENGMPTDLTGKKVLDIGAWTGGMSLLLYAMGEPHLVVVEEVRKYAAAITYLKSAFDLNNMHVFGMSLYDLKMKDGYFDLINFSGVLYHLTDPVLALKIISNMLKIGGTLVLETSTMPNKSPVLYYAGPSKVTGNSNWNWFFPSWPFLYQCLEDVGIEIIATEKSVRGRLVGVKRENKPMMQCGMSIRR